MASFEDAFTMTINSKAVIAHFKIPQYIRCVSEFPMTVTGKVRKMEMREQSITQLGLESVAKTQMA